jgi:hypothetical protein
MTESKQIKFLTIGIFIYTILPFLVLSFYNVPLGDDFWYAETFKTYGFWETQLKFYYEWSGRYIASAAISTLNPISYDYFKISFILPLFLIIGFAFALLKLIKNSIIVLKLPINSGLFFCLLYFFYFNYIPDFGESFYWMAGAYTYQLPIVFFLFYLNLILNLFKTDNKAAIFKNQFLAIICLFIILGCNEVIVVYANFINLLIILYLVLNKNYFNRFTLLFLFTLVVSFWMITAPGNFGRASIFEKTNFHFVTSSFNALSRSIFVIGFWLASLFILMLNLKGVSDFKNLNVEKFNKFFKSNKSVVLGSIVFLIGVLFIGFFPSIYTTKWIPQRAYTPIFFIFMIFSVLLIIILINKLDWMRKVNSAFSMHTTTIVILPILILALSHNSNVMNAYVDLTSGKASSYNRQVIKTYEMLQTNTKDTVYINPIQKKPLILPFRWPGDNRMVNTEWENFFKIKRIEYLNKNN